MSRLERDAAAVRQKAKNFRAAAHYAGSGDSAEMWAANGGLPSQTAGVKCKNVDPMDMPPHELRNMYEAPKHRVPYKVEIGTKGFSDGSGLGMKTPGSPVVEGARQPLRAMK